MAWYTPLAAVMRAVGSLPGGRLVARGAYWAAATAAAQGLSRIAGVDGVYLTGSLTRPELVAPGVSDIDLVVLADLDDAGHELELRRQLRRAHRLLSVTGPLFHHIDYLCLEDLPFERAFGGLWAIDLDQRWIPLAGRDRRTRPAPRSRRERDLEALFEAMTRWAKAAGWLLAPGRMAPAVRRRHAERVLTDMLAAATRRDRLTPLACLLAQAGSERELPTLAMVCDAQAQSTVEELLAAALELLDRTARRLTSDWRAPWRGEAPAARPHLPAALQRRVVETLRRGGFEDIALARRGPGDDDQLVIAIGPPGASATEVIRGARQALGQLPPLPEPHFTWSKHPAFLTAHIWHAAALLEPAPFLGGGFAMSPTWLSGGGLPSPPAPGRDDWAAVVRARVVTQFHRIRGHGLRTRRTSWTGTERLDRHLTRALPALSALQDRCVFEAPRQLQPKPKSELDRVARMRDWIRERRSALEPLLERAQR